MYALAPRTTPAYLWRRRHTASRINGTNSLLLFVGAIFVGVVHGTFLTNVGAVCHRLPKHQNASHARDNRTYTQNFVRNLLGLSLPFLEVRATPIKLSGVDFFIERGLDAEQFFVRRKLIPAPVRGARAEGYIIAV